VYITTIAAAVRSSRTKANRRVTVASLVGARLTMPSSTTTTDFSKPPDANTLRILIATDTHLGAHESNAIRKDDAFLAFEEIFETAIAARVDCVFLAGDVFDINKPSRETLVRTMEILRKHAFGDKPVAVEVVSDTKENFPSRGARFERRLAKPSRRASLSRACVRACTWMVTNDSCCIASSRLVSSQTNRYCEL